MTQASEFMYLPNHFHHFFAGFTYMITRTRLLPRLRAQITNKPYDDMHFNERGQAVSRSTNVTASTSSVA